MPSLPRAALALIAVLLCLGGYVACTAPPGPRSLTAFAPDRIADLEVGMWRAYYAKDRLGLFGGLVRTLREQYRYSWAQAAVTSFYLARAASTFGAARSDYERVLPDLERAYTRTGALSRACSTNRIESFTWRPDNRLWTLGSWL